MVSFVTWPCPKRIDWQRPAVTQNDILEPWEPFCGKQGSKIAMAMVGQVVQMEHTQTGQVRETFGRTLALEPNEQVHPWQAFDALEVSFLVN